MTKISDLNFDEKYLTWSLGNERISIEKSEVSQALEDEKRNLVFALIGGGNKKTLHILSASGKSVAVLPPPQGFSFSYITKHPEVGVAIVAGADERVDGWYDWHFGFEESENVLFRHCPSY